MVVAHDGDDLAKRMREREREKERERRLDLVVARNGDDWCGGGSLWRSNEGSVRRESPG